MGWPRDNHRWGFLLSSSLVILCVLILNNCSSPTIDSKPTSFVSPTPYPATKFPTLPPPTLVLTPTQKTSATSSPAGSSPTKTVLSSDKSVISISSEDRGYDVDGDGLFEFLEVSVELIVGQTGWYGFTPALLGPQGQFVAVGDLSMDLQRSAPVTSLNLARGEQGVPIYFDGRAIHASGIDGPYQVILTIVDELGTNVLELKHTTSIYSNESFQGG